MLDWKELGDERENFIRLLKEVGGRSQALGESMVRLYRIMYMCVFLCYF